MKRLMLSCSFFLIVSHIISAFNQTPEIDSLEYLLDRNGIQDTAEVNLLNIIAFKYYQIDNKKLNNYAEEANVLAHKLKYDAGIAESLRLKGIYCYSKSDNLRAQEFLNESLILFEKLGDKGGKVQCLNIIGRTHWKLGDYPQAHDYFKQAYSLAIQIDNKSLISKCLDSFGILDIQQGNYTEAIKYLQESIKLKEQLGDKKGISDNYHNIGYIHMRQGNYPEAIIFFQRTLETVEEAGDKRGAAGIYINLGIVQQNQGNFAEAIDYYQKALKVYEDFGEKEGISMCQNNIGLIYKNRGQYSKALDYIQNSLKIKEEIGDKRGISSCLMNIGSIHEEQGNSELGFEYLEKSMHILEELEDKRGVSNCLLHMAVYFGDLKQYDQAHEHFEKALTIKEELEDKHGISNCLKGIGNIYELEGKDSLALVYYRKALKMKEELSETSGICHLFTDIANVYTKRMQYGVALQYANKGLEIADSLEMVETKEKIHKLLSEIYSATKEYKKAYQNHVMHKLLYDSIFNEKEVQKIAGIEYQYKYEKELQAERFALAEQKLEDELAQRKKNLRTYISYGLILVLGLFGYLILRNRQRQIELLRQQKHNEKLEHIDKLKDQFLANTSHELRTPLQGIIGLSESLLEREKAKEKRKELAMITTSGKRLSVLVNSILDFSRLKNHDLQFSKKHLDLRTISDVVIKLSQPLIKNNSVVLINEIDQSIPLVYADEDRMYQVMHNLIGNAIKFTSEGMITISSIEEQNSVQICVEDTGMGIPEDMIEDVFKSFEQVEASITREHGGTGLGLTITKQLIELHGGNIWIESKVDVGTKVFFTLPKSKENKNAIDERQSFSKAIEPIAVDNGDRKLDAGKQLVQLESAYSILVVDDEPINQQVLYNYLTHEKFRIYQAMNGPEALKIIEQGKPDIVLLDIMMPKMSGYEVCKEIRKKYLASELPIIMITAKDQISDLVEGLSSGANDYLTKPFSKDELLARLKTHLNLYHINSAYLRFIPKEFIKALGHDSIVDVALGDQVQGDMTILYSDIRSFTTITEKLSARESFEFLNELLDSITPAITVNGGFIDKFIGDATMALFPSNPENAIIAAIQIQKKLSEYNTIREKRGEEKIKIGIGIHTGSLMLGTIGVKNRMDGTVISDAVNLASRLEELNKLYGTSMIVSENTYKKLKTVDKYNYRFLSYAHIKGKTKGIKIYEFFDGDEKKMKSMKLKTLSIFNEGIIEYYNMKFAKASVKFQDVIDCYPEDRTARLFLENSAKYMVQGVPDHREGEDIAEKIV